MVPPIEVITTVIFVVPLIEMITTTIFDVAIDNHMTWTTTKQLNAQIDSFQRRLIRKFILNVKWPDVVKNEQVYSITKLKPWSETIKLRRIKWFGKIGLVRKRGDIYSNI